MLLKKFFFVIMRKKEKGKNMFTKSEMNKVEAYLQAKFKNPTLVLKEGTGKDAPAELMLGGEFMGVVYKNEDEGEVSYDLNISILADDL